MKDWRLSLNGHPSRGKFCRRYAAGSQRVMEAILPMRKLDINALKPAYHAESKTTEHSLT